jgi:acetylornithine deacetylase
VQNEKGNSAMETTEQKVLNAIDIDGLLDFLGKLVSVRSVTGSEGENTAQEIVAERLGAIGMDVDTWDLDFDELRRHPAYCVQSERERGVGVVGSSGSGAGRSLIFNGHVDVVPIDDPAHWRYPPWEMAIADRHAYGRGVLDMKGGLCCAIYAVKAIQDAGVTLTGRLMIQSVIAEEDGGLGTLAAVMRGYQADGAVIVEPTNLVVAPSQAGALNFRITIPGKTAHAAVRKEGISAIEKFIPTHEALIDLECERNRDIRDPMYAAYDLPFALNIGNIHGGEWASNVPESLVFEGRYGVAPGEDVVEARHALEAAVASAAQKDAWMRTNPPVVEWWGAQFNPAQTTPDSSIISTVADTLHDLCGKETKIQGMTYGADMRLLVNHANTPCVLFGPGDIRQAHQPDECVPIEDLIMATRTLALTALRFCGWE